MRTCLLTSIVSAVTGTVLGATAAVMPAEAGGYRASTRTATITTAATVGDGFRAEIHTIGAAAAKAMTGVSWHPGCPVPIADLRRVELTYRDFHGARHQGELIVDKNVAAGVADIFHKLYSMRFPIRMMQPVDHFGGDDDASMAADNTSAFNCRPITGSTTGFSVHSYGRAIDLDTLENPYVKGAVVQPPAGKAFTNRAAARPGMIRHGDPVWRAFAGHGFTWGGDWHSLKDYQHFELPAVTLPAARSTER